MSGGRGFAALAAKAFALCALLTACGLGRPAPEVAPATEDGLLLAGGFVVDPASSAEPVRADVLVSGDRIVEVRPALRAPAGTRRIDVSGRYLIPGLWDMHAHVAAVGETGNALEDYMAHGVLAIRDMGGRVDEVLALKADVAAGRRMGPTLFVAGPTLNGEASADFHWPVRTAAEAAEAVRRLKDRGVDFIKIHRQTSRESFYAIRDQSQRDGFFFGGHVPLAIDWIEASKAGMRTVEHVQTIVENEIETGPDPVKATFEALDRLNGARGDEIFSTLARDRTYWTPTLIFYENSWKGDFAERKALKQRAYARMRPLVARAARSGVPILAGTDWVSEGRGRALQEELVRLVEAGLTPRQALAAATTNPHTLFGRGPGRLRRAAEASIVILEADPLKDIAHVRRISMVLLRGRPIAADESGR